MVYNEKSVSSMNVSSQDQNSNERDANEKGKISAPGKDLSYLNDT